MLGAAEMGIDLDYQLVDLRTGELVDGVTVTEIERSTVIVEFDGKTKVLELK